MMTPCRTAGSTGEIAKRWTIYRQLAIQSKHNSPDIAKNSLPLYPPENIYQCSPFSQNRALILCFTENPPAA
jgi:hypothetical protein